MMKKFSRMIQGFGMVVGLLVLATSVQAATIGPITQGDGTYSWTTGTNSISITLTDIALNPENIGQNISGFTFGAAGGGDEAFQFVTPTTTGGVITLGADTTSGATPIQWSFSGSSSLYVLGWNPPAPPDYTIIGVSNNDYSGANGSLMNNDPHNPFILYTATFVLPIDGITSDTTLSNATIMFGTQWSPSTPVPEPGTMMLLGSGLVGLAGWGRKKFRK